MIGVLLMVMITGHVPSRFDVIGWRWRRCCVSTLEELLRLRGDYGNSLCRRIVTGRSASAAGIVRPRERRRCVRVVGDGNCIGRRFEVVACEERICG